MTTLLTPLMMPTSSRGTGTIDLPGRLHLATLHTKVAMDLHERLGTALTLAREGTTSPGRRHRRWVGLPEDCDGGILFPGR
jgi:hypothetical protein